MEQVRIDTQRIHESISNNHILMQDFDVRDDLYSNSGRDSSNNNREGSLMSSRSSSSNFKEGGI